MNPKQIKEIKNLVQETCKKETNYFGEDIWSKHILRVIYYSKKLAKKLKADEEVVEIAAILHDYASVLHKNLYEEHHIHGATLAEAVLKKYNYPDEKIEQVKHCILTHRASRNLPKKTIEAEIVASADAMAHFDNVEAIFYLAFNTHKMSIDEGVKWVLKKLENDWNKLIPEAKEMMKDKYSAIKKSFSS